jgi:hypothetical protein
MVGQILPQQAVPSSPLLLDLKSKQSGGILSPADQMMSLIQVTRYGLITFHLIFKLLMKLFSKGPVMAYMKKVTDSTTDVGYGSGWFKISEAGLNVASKISIMASLVYY